MNATLLISIGNTHTQLATPDGDVLGDVREVMTADLIADPGGCGIPAAAVAVIASVVPAATDVLTAYLGSIHVICAESTGVVDFSAVDTATLGADRIANAVGVAAYSALPAIVVDCGTAITMEVIDSNRCFRGGVIIPGRQLCRDALHDGTALLPPTPLTDALHDLPAVNTADAIMAGVDHTLLAGVRSILETLSATLDGDPEWLATGGDADFFCTNIPLLEVAPPHLTLLGILAVSKAI
jgi:type III pantothenate kinase